ncbi:MAG: SDR family NAD(P)-dependent oxidoreductase [Proteobacteria bacterium]|nr:SDR family NAD(P)-dependent oxidoreductase [Pseudomonadota bacterium]
MRAAAVFGAGGGIGRALVAGLAASGDWSLVHAGARQPQADLPAGARAFAFDLADEASIADAVAGFDPLPDLTMVATGLLHDPARDIAPERSLRAISGGAMAQLFAANTIGPALIAKHLLPRLPRDRRVVFAVLSARVGSIGDNRLGGWHAYRASKAALNMLVANFAIELRRTHPLAIIAALHPGTVASALSAPFQSGVAPQQLFTPAAAAGHLLRVVAGLTPADSGGFFAWDGARLPW